MNAGPPSDAPPPEPPPGETPAAEPPPEETPAAEPPAAEPPAAAEPAGRAEPAAESAPSEPTPAQPAPETAAPPQAYFPPPMGQPGVAPHRRGAGPLIAIIVVVVVVIVAVLGYGVGGYAYAGAKLNDAQDKYNAVVDHQNTLNDTLRSLDTSFPDVSGSASASSVTQAKANVSQMITKSQDAQPQIASDDASLASASSSLDQNSWLTVLRKPDIDKAHSRIDHLRKALALAKTLTADYVQVGNFEQALLDVVSDLDDLSAKASASDLTGADAADQKLKTDIDKAISLDKAPGLPATMDQLLQALKALGNDFGTLISDARSGNQAGAQAAENALMADATKIQAIDESKMDTDIKGYYDPLVAQYNSEISAANSV